MTRFARKKANRRARKAGINPARENHPKAILKSWKREMVQLQADFPGLPVFPEWVARYAELGL